MSNPPQRTLFVRMDRIGDLVLTLPADQHPLFKNTQNLWFISKGLGFIPQHALPPRQYVEWRRNFSWSQLWHFIKAVRDFAPDVSISFHSPWWVTFALWWARVPTRVGVLSSWHSFLFLNKGLRQKRSRCEFHEMDYNHQLIQKTLAPQEPPMTMPLKLQAPNTNVPISGDYIVVHPGMAGSALNWPVESYKQLIELLTPHIQVVVTGTAMDRAFVQPLYEQLQKKNNILWLQEKLSAPELLSVLQKARAVFAPSTGVVHLAASLGTPTRAIYSPVFVERAQRWGPRGTDVKTWTPNINGPDYFDCMKLVSAKEIAENLLKTVQR